MSEQNEDEKKLKPEISFDDFLKLDMRIGTIIEASKIPKSEKLVKLDVDFGTFQRQIVAGIGLSFGDDLPSVVGRQFTFAVNIAPRKIFGVESHGMILASGYADDLALLAPTHEVVAGAAIS